MNIYKRKELSTKKEEVIQIKRYLVVISGVTPFFVDAENEKAALSYISGLHNHVGWVEMFNGPKKRDIKFFEWSEKGLSMLDLVRIATRNAPISLNYGETIHGVRITESGEVNIITNKHRGAIPN